MGKKRITGSAGIPCGSYYRKMVLPDTWVAMGTCSGRLPAKKKGRK